MAYLCISTPLGDVTLFEEDGALIALEWGGVEGGEETPLLCTARDQLEAYFDGERQAFDLPLTPMGTAFQQSVWAALRMIPYGQTQSYGEIAKRLGTSARAIGGACGRNPLPILIPCHRVLGQTGRLTGYSGGEGEDTKRVLLILEGALSEDA